MVLTQKVGNEIKNYLLSLLGKDVMVINSDGICIAASLPEDVNNEIDIPKEALLSDSIVQMDFKGQSRLFIPLVYDDSRVATLILDEDREKVQEYLPLIKSFAELLISQFYVNNRPTMDSTDQFVVKLLNNASVAEYPLYESESKVLGYDLRSKRLAIVVHLDGFWESTLLSMDQPSFERDGVIKNTKKKIETIINEFFSKNNDVVIAYLGNDKFVVYKAVDSLNEDTVKKFLKRSYKAIFEPLKNFRIKNITVGFGNPYAGIHGLVSAYKEADLALELGRKLWGGNKSYYFGDLGILSVLGEGNREENLQFADKMLGNMKNEDLQKTLECFFDQNLNLTETALKMRVHRNTVIYRLNQISRILGADPRIFEQAMTIKIALLIKKLF